MSQENEYPLEAQEIVVYEIKENVPPKEAGKKAGTRSLGFARTEDHAAVILENLRHGGKAVEKEAYLIKPKDGEDQEVDLIIKGKIIKCIFYIDNHSKLPLEQYRAFSKDQQRFLTLIGESVDEENGEDED